MSRTSGVAPAAAIALAAAVMTLTPTSSADSAAPAAPVAAAADSAAIPATSAATPATSGSTPLALRPNKPLELAPEPQHASTAWKLGALLSLLGASAFWLQKRRRPAGLQDPRLGIVRRVSVGFRSELVVVDVEGQRLLLGVTPHTIQSLAVLDGDDLGSSSSPSLPTDAWPMAERFDALLEATRSRARPTADDPGDDDRPGKTSKAGEDAAAPGQAPAAAPPADVAGQARGLLSLKGKK